MAVADLGEGLGVEGTGGLEGGRGAVLVLEARGALRVEERVRDERREVAVAWAARG